MWYWRITGNSNVAIQTGSTHIADSMTDITEIPMANLEFSTSSTAKKLTRAIATTTDNRKRQYRCFGRQYCNFWQSVVVAIIWLIFCRARHHRKSRIWRWNLDAICHSSTDVIISGFGGLIDISACRSLLHSLANIILYLYMVLYPTVVGILTVPLIA